MVSTASQSPNHNKTTVVYARRQYRNEEQGRKDDDDDDAGGLSITWTVVHLKRVMVTVNAYVVFWGIDDGGMDGVSSILAKK
jgi:hypothetical protein